MSDDTETGGNSRRTFLKAAGVAGIASLAGCLGGGGGGSTTTEADAGEETTEEEATEEETTEAETTEEEMTEEETTEADASMTTGTETGGEDAAGTVSEDGTTSMDEGTDVETGTEGDTESMGNESAGTTMGTAAGSGETVRFILNPAEAGVPIVEQYQPMFDHIEEETGVTIEATRAESYTATLQTLRNDQGEIADVSPSATVAGEGVIDVVGRRIAFGAAQYFSTITTTMDSGIQDLSGLEGETVAFADILSVSGTLVPLTMLQDAGLDTGDAPDGDPVDFEAEYSDHETAREQMMQRPDVAAAGTGAFQSAPYVSQDQFQNVSQQFANISAEYEGAGEEGNDLRLLAISDPLPRAPIVARSNWDSPARDPVEQAILGATEEDLSHGEDYEGEALWFTGVEEATLEDYAVIGEVLDSLGLEFGDLAGTPS